MDVRRPAPTGRLDVVVVADFRVGDTGAEESVALVEALSQAGLTTGVVQWFGAAAAEPARIHPRLDEVMQHPNARRMAAGGAATTDLVIATDARLFLHPPGTPLNLDAPRRIVLCRRAFATTPGRAGAVLAHAAEALGGPVWLAPAAPPMREMLDRVLPNALVTPEDWPPILAPVTDGEPPYLRPTIPALGWHCGPTGRSAPETDPGPRGILPDHHDIALKLFGLPDHLRADFGGHAGPLEIWPARPGLQSEFFRSIDMLAASGDPTEDPFPEEVMAALARGVIPILPPAFRACFRDTAVYADVTKVARTALDLFSAPPRMEHHRAAAGRMIATELSAGAMVARVTDAIGPAFRAPLVSRAALRPEVGILSLSTNGIGMGHLTRQMAIARRMDRHVRTTFLGLSYAVGVPAQFGYVAEFEQFHAGIGLDDRFWNLTMAERIEAALAFYRPRVIVIDANEPFQALETVRSRHGGLGFVWVRRAMWGAGRDRLALDRAGLFDLIVEPGDYAAAYDTGPTVATRGLVRQVGPILLADPSEALSREDAAAEVGIEPDTLNVLLMPGAMNNFDSVAFWQDAVRELSGWPRTRVVLAEWAISDRKLDLPPSVLVRRGFPFSRWFRAFDFCLTAGGYNSFNEVLANGLPAIFVPNENPLMDRQDLRARFAERNGLGLSLSVREPYRLSEALARMRDPEVRAVFRRRMAGLPAPTGGAEAAEIIQHLAEGGLAHRPDAWA